MTSAVRAGEPERRVMGETGHKSVEMVLRYVRQANAFTDNSALAPALRFAIAEVFQNKAQAATLCLSEAIRCARFR